MAARRVALRGRAVVAIVLATFLVVATSVVWRRSLGSVQARRLQQLSSRLTMLQGERSQLERDIRRITSRPYLTPVVARLGLSIPSDSQVIVLRVKHLRER